MSDIRGVGGSSPIYPAQTSDTVNLNSTVTDIGKQWYDSSESGTWQPPTPDQQKQWASQLQQEASQDPNLQQFLNNNPSILDDLNSGALTIWQLEPIFKELTPLLNVQTMTADQKINLAKGWTSCAYNDVVSGYSSAESFQKFKDSIHAAVGALELIANSEALQTMQKAQAEVDSIVYQPGMPEPLAFNQAATNTYIAMKQLSQI